MGQRLVINFYNHNKLIANCYYHWSAYTRSSYGELAEFYDNYLNTDGRVTGSNEEDERLHVIRALMKISPQREEQNEALKGSDIYEKFGLECLTNDGARFDVEDVEYAKSLYPNEVFADQSQVNRSNGLIAVSEKEMQNSISYAEGLIEVYLDKQTFDFDVFGCIGDSFEEFKEYYEEFFEEEIKEEEIPVIHYGTRDVPLEKIYDIVDEINSINEYYAVFDNGDEKTYVTFIE